MSALLTLHILAALASIVTSSLLFVRPSKANFRAAYALIAATLGSGTYLVWTQPAHHVAQTCLSGVLYIGVVLSGIVFARYKLAREHIVVKRPR